MKKIRSKEELEKSQRTMKIIMSIFIISLLFLSVAGFAFTFNPNPSNQEQEEQEFLTSNTFVVNGQQLTFSFTPQVAQLVQANIESDIDTYIGKQLYISSDDPAVINEIGSTLGRFTSRFQEACFGSCSKDLPEKSCEDNLIIVNASKIGNVYQEDGCIFIEGDVLSADAFLYKIFRIT